MRKSIRFVAVLAFFAISANLHSFGSSVLCQSLPATKTVGQTLIVLFGCAIPANAVPVGKSLRITVNLHAVNSGTQGVVSYIEANGTIVAAASTGVQSAEEHWDFMITNTGGTSSSFGGTSTGNVSTLAWGPGNGTRPTIPWSSAWSLQIPVAFNSGTFTVDGDTFVVEIVN